MLNKYLSLIVLTSALTLSAFPGTAFATQKPEFMSCVNPTGEVISTYSDGVHGVAGDLNSYNGKDVVYSSPNGTNTQCLCPTSGNGIQTNWLKASDLTQDEISIYINQGWTLIPNGSAWGLGEGSYLAQNISYSCNGGSSSSSSSSNNSGSSDSKVDAAYAINQALSLANTGNIKFIILVFLCGIAFMLGGLISLNKKRV